MIESLQNLWNEIYTNIGLTIVYSLVFLVIGLIIIKLIQTSVRKTTIRSRKLDNAASSFITSVVTVVLYIILIIVLLSTLGVSTTAIIASFSASALAIALGLQNTLSSLTNGILIIFTKPFKQGDYIDVGGVSGTVKNIRLFNVSLNTPDNLTIIIPNSTILNSNLTNYSTMPIRRVDITVPVSYSVDIDQVKNVLLNTISHDTRIVNTPAPFCRLTNYGSSSLDFTIRVWVEKADFWNVKFDLLENIFKDLKKSNIEIPFDQLDVHLINSSSDKEENT